MLFSVVRSIRRGAKGSSRGKISFNLAFWGLFLGVPIKTSESPLFVGGFLLSSLARLRTRRAPKTWRCQGSYESFHRSCMMCTLYVSSIASAIVDVLNLYASLKRGRAGGKNVRKRFVRKGSSRGKKSIWKKKKHLKHHFLRFGTQEKFTDSKKKSFFFCYFYLYLTLLRPLFWAFLYG